MQPWRHSVQVDPDGSAEHPACGRHELGRTLQSEPASAWARPSTARSWAGSATISVTAAALRRMDLTDAIAAPGECGADAPEIRMPRQMTQVGDRYFFAGRGGAVEAAWNGIEFRLCPAPGRHLPGRLCQRRRRGCVGIAYTDQGNDDVQHAIEIPKCQPTGRTAPGRRPFAQPAGRGLRGRSRGPSVRLSHGPRRRPPLRSAPSGAARLPVARGSADRAGRACWAGISCWPIRSRARSGGVRSWTRMPSSRPGGPACRG